MTAYASHALQYLDGAIGYPIPSAFPYEKHPPLIGWTGTRGAIPDQAQVERWVEQYPDSNILLRMAPDVIGIDIDNYDDKLGERTILAIADRHGRLPPTYISSARPLPSGIHFYRLRPWMETSKMRDPGTHVEVIRFEHRYAVVPPSWHSGVRSKYLWTDGVTPQKGDLGWLPVEWYVHLVRSCDCFEDERAIRRVQMRRFHNRRAGDAGVEDAVLDLKMACEALALTGEGGRNNLLSSIAGRVFLYDVVSNGVLTPVDAANTLTDAAEKAGLDPTEVKRTLESAWDWAMREGAEK